MIISRAITGHQPPTDANAEPRRAEFHADRFGLDFVFIFIFTADGVYAINACGCGGVWLAQGACLECIFLVRQTTMNRMDSD